MMTDRIYSNMMKLIRLDLIFHAVCVNTETGHIRNALGVVIALNRHQDKES